MKIIIMLLWFAPAVAAIWGYLLASIDPVKGLVVMVSPFILIYSVTKVLKEWEKT